MNRELIRQGGVCPISREEFADYSDMVSHHKNPKGNGRGLEG